VHWTGVYSAGVGPKGPALERFLERNNSYGNFLELSEYGGRGQISFVIILEGNDGKGWVDYIIPNHAHIKHS
jgi:hypothetical protein